ncbi:NACHT, LRR and PYD domains-containing protein 12 [Parambassis ranga]|uniref:NACHT, LRR and PYD domains-containing protein 12 n=1 Tax=Parambassis ranga TaxID=210632 RepID=A0A6P7IJM5_9TELE|nr:NACHT, LRR and PYD domains-containing protein 12-like [Parambassis ranga]
MDKAAVLTHILESRGVVTLLGGELPVSVINNNKYIPPLTAGSREEGDLPSLDHAIQTALSGEIRTVTVIGPEGCGKTTALEKLVVDWAKGEQLQNFSHVFHLRFRQLNSLEGELSLETLIQRHLVPPVSISLALQKPQDVLFVMDGLDEYKHSLDPSIHSLCSDPSQPASVSCIVASLLHGSLLEGAAFVVATRPTGCVEFLSGTQVEVLGFLKPQREAYFNSFFTDPADAKKALMHMERTLGFYDFCSSPRWCWTVCSIYKSLIDSGAIFPETLSQLFVDILVHLLNMLSLNQACNRELVSALGRVASHCCLDQLSSCTKEQMNLFGFKNFLTSVGLFLRANGEPDSKTCMFSFHSQLMQQFLLAVSFFLDTSTCNSVEKLLNKHEGATKFLDLFLAGLSEPVHYRQLEALMGEFNTEQVRDFKCWFESSSNAALKGCYKDKHHRCFHLLHQAQNESLVKEIITPSARINISYCDLSLRDSVALNYVVTRLGQMETLNLYYTRNLTEEKAEALASAMSLSDKIILSQSSLSTGAIHHLASALSRGLTTELDLSSSRLGDEKFKILCSGLRDCKLYKLNIPVCSLTEGSCDDLASVLVSDTSQLHVLDMTFNQIGDQGFVKLCRALRSPHCKLQELQLQNCELTAASMGALSAALGSDQSKLRKVNLTQNQIGDSGVESFCKSLQHPLCKLHSIVFYDCELTGESCSHLKEALMSEHCSLSELNMSVNDLGQEGALLLCQALSRPNSPLVKLCLKRCQLTLTVFERLGLLLRSGTSQLKSLIVGINKVGDQGVKHLWDAVAHPNCLLEELDVEMTGLTDACVEDMCAAIKASKTLKHLELRNNMLTNASIPALIQVMEENQNMQEMNIKYNDIGDEMFDSLDECERIRY